MENQSPQEKKKNVILISLLTFIVLFILPLGSVYFLNSGLKYRKASLSEMGDHGKMGAFEFKNQTGLTITPQLLRGSVCVAHFLSENDSTARYQINRLKKVHQSFDDVSDVVFLSFTKKDPNVNLLAKAKALGITDHQQWFLPGYTETDKKHLAQTLFKLEDPENGIALADTSLTIRRYYDITKNEEMGRLVEQIAIVLPKQKRRGL